MTPIDEPHNEASEPPLSETEREFIDILAHGQGDRPHRVMALVIMLLSRAAGVEPFKDTPLEEIVTHDSLQSWDLRTVMANIEGMALFSRPDFEGPRWAKVHLVQATEAKILEPGEELWTPRSLAFFLRWEDDIGDWRIHAFGREDMPIKGLEESGLGGCVQWVGPGEDFADHGSGLNRRTIHVTREDFGRDWPLIVDSGDLSCEPPGIVTFTTGGKTYALNGLAESRGYPSINPIVAHDPDAIPIERPEDYDEASEGPWEEFPWLKTDWELSKRGEQLCEE